MKQLKQNRPQKGKPVHEQVLLSIFAIEPSPENALLYKPVTDDDPETIALADSIKERGILEPIVISLDTYILSGHRRQRAALMAGLRKVPCRIDNIRRGHGAKASDEFVKRLREYNRQRIKTREELLRETVTDIDPRKAHKALTAYRKEKAKIKLAPMELRQASWRCEISPAKMPFLHAIERIIDEQEQFWPLSLRQIHYLLLNDPPLIHAAKAESRYRNNLASYRALIDLVTRARHEGLLEYETIHDPTRPITVWDVQLNLAAYYKAQLDDLLQGYWRDLMQSQPNHIELVAEKITLQNILSPISSKFCIPSTIGRGQCSTRPLYDIAQRYKKSGKEKLVILAVSDLDPDGDAIAHSLGQRLRDDFRIEQVDVFKCALTMSQVNELALPEKYERAKRKSPNYRRYVETYETDRVWELEAVQPATLQRLIERAVDQVIDRKAFNYEATQERKDAAHNAAVRERVLNRLREQIETGS
jgi:hypothetical protein